MARFSTRLASGLILALAGGQYALAQSESIQNTGDKILQEGENSLNASQVVLQETATETVNGLSSATSTAGKVADHIIASIPHDLSPIGMFVNADWVVKAVMVGLALASVATWVIFVVKFIEISAVKRRAKATLKAAMSAESLSELALVAKKEKGVGAVLVQAAQDEVQASLAVVDAAGTEGLKERLSSVLSRIVSASGRHVSSGTGVLATIGAIGPFVGLFGTVWGIMNSFIGISRAQTTNLAVVAPGIAEALLATAIGLVAAVPAVIIYNFFARSITGYRQQLIDVSSAIERLVSRDLDFRKVKRETTTRSNLSIAAE
ncbi:tonB-system energizer ExbB [uncultured Bartonella sp.]|uniref:tonB-system energizer ExbB n=1 Tax=uncultured Bartonella sp. TaxID=104108 RepID=UPI00263A0AE5|nr:tonB-system energizer ExbB [uncultured Bartonella sp.]